MNGDAGGGVGLLILCWRPGSGPASLDALKRTLACLDELHDRVDRAIRPWEHLCEMALEVRAQSRAAVESTDPGDGRRDGALRALIGRVDRDLPNLAALAVRHALTEDLGRNVEAACRQLNEAGRGVVEAAVRAPRDGDTAWVRCCARFDHAVLCTQALHSAQRRAVDDAQARGWAAAVGVQNSGRRPVPTKARIERLARDAVRRAHQGYIDDDIFAAAIAGGLSYRKAAQELSRNLARKVTKRQVEEAVKRRGGLKTIRDRSRDFPERHEL